MIERTYRVSDTVTEQFLRLPMALLANPKYNAMSLEAKFVYALLLDRLSLSQKNGWVNEENEVYLIYTREEIAKLLNITYKKAIGAFKELVDNNLLYEQRQGRGYANLLFVLKPELTEEDAAEFCEEFYESESENEEKEPENLCGTQMCQNGISRTAKSAHLELPNRHIKNCQNGTSRTAETAHLDMPKSHPSHINNINNNITETDSSQSVSQQDKTSSSEKTLLAPAQLDGQTEAERRELEEIFARCDFESGYLEDGEDSLIPFVKNAITQMFYTERLVVGRANYPQEKVRRLLHTVTPENIFNVLDIMRRSQKPVRNSLGYFCSVLYNEIAAGENIFFAINVDGQAYGRKDQSEESSFTLQDALTKAERSLEEYVQQMNSG